MANFTRATARPYLDGIKDDSAGSIPLQLEAIPQNCPVYMFQARKGRSALQFTVGEEMIKHYHADTFDETKKFYSHQTAMLMTTAGAGNLIAAKRLIPDDAEAAVICVGLEVVENNNTVWQVKPDGSYVVNVNGQRIDTGDTVDGYLVRLVRMDGIDQHNYDKQVVTNGTLTGNTTQTSKIYPLFAFMAEVGEDGQNVGFRISTETALSAQPSDQFAQEDQEAMLYRFSWMTRNKVGAAPTIYRSLNQAEAIDFGFKHGMFNSKTNKSYDFRRIQDAYESIVPGYTPKYGPVEGVHFYSQFIDQVSELLFTKESAATGAFVTAKEAMNVLGGADYMGRAFKTIDSAPVTANSIVTDGQTTNYLQGGADGTISEEKLDELALAFLEGDWDNPEEPLNDWARYPFSGFHDSGFGLETKKAMLTTMGRRDDITVDVCTFIASEPTADMATELAVGQTLVSHGLLIPESVIHGTQACRFNVWGSEGIQANSLFKRRASAFLDIAAKYAEFAGAASGVLKADKAYDDRTRNGVTKVTGITHTYKTNATQDKYWDLGINYSQYRTTSEVFFAAYQTAYEDDTSVLNSVMYVKILTYLKRLAKYHWAINTNTTGLTDEEFIERSDADWATLVEGRFAGKMVITGSTVITPDDSERGFSWNLDINAAADPMRTVGQYNITVTRLS